MTAILSWAEMPVSGKLDPAKQKRGAEIIRDSGRTQAQLINDLLDISRVISGKFALELVELERGPAVLVAIESVRSLADKKSTHIETSFAPWIRKLNVDPTRLRQVIWNLLTNAIKF